jgi:hypothetical protein
MVFRLEPYYMGTERVIPEDKVEQVRKTYEGDDEEDGLAEEFLD